MAVGEYAEGHAGKVWAARVNATGDAGSEGVVGLASGGRAEPGCGVFLQRLIHDFMGGRSRVQQCDERDLETSSPHQDHLFH